MKIKKLWSLLCIAIMLVIPTCIAVAKEGRTDEAPITISDVTLSEKTCTSGETLKYKVVVKPVKKVMESQMNYYECNKVVSLTLQWTSQKQQEINRTYKWDGESKIVISDKIVIENGMQNGKWRLNCVHVNYDGKEYDYSVGVYSDVNKNTNDLNIKAKFPTSEFTVKGTTPDNNAPSIKLSSMKMSKRVIEAGQKSVFSVKVTDASTIEGVYTRWEVYDKNSNSAGCKWVKARYNKKTKRYECNLKLAKKYTMKKLVEIEAVDIYCNSNYYIYNPNSSKKTMKQFNKMSVALKSSYFAKNIKNADNWPIVKFSQVTLETDNDKIYLDYSITYNDRKSKYIQIFRSEKKNSGFKLVSTEHSLGDDIEFGDDGYNDYDVIPGKTYYYKSRIVKIVNGKKTYSNFSPVVSCKVAQ